MGPHDLHATIPCVCVRVRVYVCVDTCMSTSKSYLVGVFGLYSVSIVRGTIEQWREQRGPTHTHTHTHTHTQCSFCEFVCACASICVLARGVNQGHPWVLLQATGHTFHTGHMPVCSEWLKQCKMRSLHVYIDPRDTLVVYNALARFTY